MKEGMGIVTPYSANPFVYISSIITDGRSLVQSEETPETYTVVLRVGDELVWGLVSKQLYESLRTDETLQVKIRRTRVTHKLEVVEVKR